MSDITGETLTLAAEFPPATREQWLRLVDGVLKGAPFERKLLTRTYDGLKIEPLYPRAAGAEAVPGRSLGAPWQIMQRVDHPDAAAANAEALHDLENGANGLSVVFPGAIGAHGFAIDPGALARVLRGIHLDAGISLEFDLSLAGKDAAFGFPETLKSFGLKPETADVRFGFDPLGQMARHGTAPARWSEIAPIAGMIAQKLAGDGFRGPFLVADGRVVHAAGGSEAQELAYTLGVALAYLRALEAAGIALDAGRRMIFFRLAADADEFLTLAKFRALRKLWARVEEACGLAPQAAFVSAETAWRMMTKRDPWVNMLRTTISAVAAGLGGANAITVLPFTAALGLPDRFARRMARNTQLILLEESNLAKVADPVAGSGGIEDLTAQLCRAAWMLFQDIETAGGAAAALERGSIQAKVAETRAEREAALARGRDPLTGTSAFPDIHELPVSVLDILPAEPTASREPAAVTFAPLAPKRLAEPFEALRDASDRVLARASARPKVFLANLGTPADFADRATFAKNFFEAGGIEAISLDAGKGATLAESFNASGAKLACICSTDKVYESSAAAAAQALAAAGARHIYLAGRPGEREAALKASGVQDFVYAGCDALKTLEAAHGILGIKA